ncbi:DUF2778 domain-containing protein [Pseudenterobacter timonensis]|uniref:DUF2778 domain-containing protein n=1 Tax=Pseudenterobacter timonensis TaxID=1755099 RepID=A0AAE4IWI7_9ENTR|nr:tlde1 domain-containing protein [Pseudenterobacter timonensis]MDR9890426.1 DUF2778 domain-containing protein [Pseudenterobacter timonensis]
MAIPAYMWLKDDGGADIKGSVDVRDREGSIEILSFGHGLHIPTDGSTGNNIYGTDRETWFALYKDDLQIDDTVFFEGVKRGNFRLHPVGPAGLSEGCITLSHQSDFDYLRQALLDTTMMQVPCSSFRAYGTVTVT